MLFVKCGHLKGKGVHKRVFAAALPGLIFRSLQQPAAKTCLAPERFADEQEPDAKPLPEGLTGQSGELPARLVFQKHAERHILLIAFSKIFSRTLFAEDYYTAWMYMPVLIIATVYSGLVTFMGSVYLVDKKSVQSLVTSMIGAGINVILNLILIPTKLGAIGAAIATFFSYFVVFIIRARDTRRFIRFPAVLEKACRQHDHPECTGDDNDV